MECKCMANTLKEIEFAAGDDTLAWYCFKHFATMISFNPYNNCVWGGITFLTSQLRKPVHREVKSTAQSHTGRRIETGPKPRQSGF